MASLLSSHLEQISLCATSIADLSFPGPKIFANALLSNHDITSLIRDTEQHERALFHLAPPPLPSKSTTSEFPGTSSGAAPSGAARRQTVYGTRQPKSKAVAAVLGGELYQKTRKTDNSGRQKGDIDVEVLLEGAERLAAVYPIPGVSDRIAQLRRRHQQLSANIEHYEARVAQQGRELQMMNRPSSGGGYEEDEEMAEPEIDVEEDPDSLAIPITKEDVENEEDEIKELERKKKALEERVTGMERDLGGLMR